MERAGIEFPHGARAIYNPATSQLVVQHTAEVHSRLRADLALMAFRRSALRIYLTARELKFSGELLDHLAQHGEESPREDRADARVEPQRTVFGWDLVKEIASALFAFPEQQPGGKPDEFTMIFDELESLQEQFAHLPLTAEEIEGARRLEVTKTLTDPQFQVLVRALAQTGNLQIETFPPVMVQIGQPVLVQSRLFRIGMIPTFVDGPENEIVLDLYLPEVGKALDVGTAGRPRPSVRTQLKDGSTVVVAEKNANGENRIVFVTAQILYPSGMPDPIDLPEKGHDSGEALGGAVFPEAAEAIRIADEFALKHVDDAVAILFDQEAIRIADEFALTASRLRNEGAYAEAESIYGTALHALPESEAAAPRRRAYAAQQSRTREAKEQQRRETRVRFAREGETLEQIAAEAGVAPGLLREANRLGDRPVRPGQMLLLPPGAEAPSATLELLSALVLPAVEFDGLPLAECLAAVQQEILRLKGPDFSDEATPVFILAVPEETRETKVTLRLHHIPAIEALRYLASLAGCQLEVEGREVVFAPLPPKQ